MILASADTSQEKYLHVNHHITSNFISVFKPYLDLGGAETSATATYASFVCAPSLVILEDFVLCPNIKCYRAVAFITSSTRLFTTVVNGLGHSFANYPWCLYQLMLYFFFERLFINLLLKTAWKTEFPYHINSNYLGGVLKDMVKCRNKWILSCNLKLAKGNWQRWW